MSESDKVRDQVVDRMVTELRGILLNGYFCPDTDAGWRYKKMGIDDKKLRMKLIEFYDYLAKPKEQPVPDQAIAGRVNGAK